FMAQSQVPWGLNALNGEVTEASWRTKPSWYLVATDDRMIPPAAQRFMSKRAGSTVRESPGSHAIYVSRPAPVVAIIEQAAGAVPALACVAPLERAGYEHRGDAGIVGHQFFRRGQPRAYHIHLVELGGRLWREYLAFRDYLRSDTRAAVEYADLKRQLAARHPRDREAYISGRSSFVGAAINRPLGAA